MGRIGPKKAYGFMFARTDNLTLKGATVASEQVVENSNVITV
jgi:hypothetical protein